MFKFFHTADIHFDSPLKSLALRDPQIAEVIGGATRRAFERIIKLCIDEQVHALIIAGDLYDGDLRSMKTFVEAIDNQIEPLIQDACDADRVDELRTLMLNVAKDSVLREKAALFLETAINTLPSELRDCYGVDQDSRECTLQRLLSEGTEAVIASLKFNQVHLENI